MCVCVCVCVCVCACVCAPIAESTRGLYAALAWLWVLVTGGQPLADVVVMVNVCAVGFTGTDELSWLCCS